MAVLWREYRLAVWLHSCCSVCVCGGAAAAAVGPGRPVMSTRPSWSAFRLNSSSSRRLPVISNSHELPWPPLLPRTDRRLRSSPNHHHFYGVPNDRCSRSIPKTHHQQPAAYNPHVSPYMSLPTCPLHVSPHVSLHPRQIGDSLHRLTALTTLHVRQT